MFDDCGVEEGGDGVEHSHVHAVGGQQQQIPRVETELLDRVDVGLFLTVLFHILSSVCWSPGLVLET